MAAATHTPVAYPAGLPDSTWSAPQLRQYAADQTPPIAITTGLRRADAILTEVMTALANRANPTAPGIIPTPPAPLPVPAPAPTAPTQPVPPVTQTQPQFVPTNPVVVVNQPPYGGRHDHGGLVLGQTGIVLAVVALALLALLVGVILGWRNQSSVPVPYPVAIASWLPPAPPAPPAKEGHRPR